MFHGVKSIWWRLRYSSKQSESLSKLQRLQQASLIITNEIKWISSSISDKSESKKSLKTRILALSNDLDYAFKNLDVMSDIPKFARKAKKTLANELFDSGAEIDDLQSMIDAMVA